MKRQSTVWTLGAADIGDLVKAGENLYTTFWSAPLDPEAASANLKSLAVAGGGTFLVGVERGGEIVGVKGHQVQDVIATLRAAGEAVGTEACYANGTRLGDKWVAYALIGKFQPDVDVEPLPLAGFTDLNPSQRRLAVILARDIDSPRYGSEAFAAATLGKGWALTLVAPDQAANREVSGFGEMDLLALAEEGYIRLLPINGYYKLAITQKTTREYQQALAVLPSASGDKPRRAQTVVIGEAAGESTEVENSKDGLPATHPDRTHIFVSYVREDKATVDRLCKALRAAGRTVWMDREAIAPGEHWEAAVRQAIRDGTRFVACFSRAYSARDRTYMNEELRLAIAELRLRHADTAWFIPVRLEECVIPRLEIAAGELLSDLQWVDLFADWDAAIARIAS